MENPNNDNEGSHTPPIKKDFLEKSLSHIMRTLNDLTDWKNQQTLQVIKIIFFKRILLLYFQWSFLKLFMRPI